MSSRKKLMAGAIVMIICMLFAATARAQDAPDLNLWGIDADVDRDGLVSATDVQHVINRALGVDETACERGVSKPDASLAQSVDGLGLHLAAGRNPLQKLRVERVDHQLQSFVFVSGELARAGVEL